MGGFVSCKFRITAFSTANPRCTIPMHAGGVGVSVLRKIAGGFDDGGAQFLVQQQFSEKPSPTESRWDSSGSGNVVGSQGSDQGLGSNTGCYVESDPQGFTACAESGCSSSNAGDWCFAGSGRAERGDWDCVGQGSGQGVAQQAKALRVADCCWLGSRWDWTRM